MMNIVKNLADRLEGFSFENQGFAITSFAMANNETEIAIALKVKPYVKDENKEALPENEELGEIIKRLSEKESGSVFFSVWHADKDSEKGIWTLTLQIMSEMEDKEKTE